MRIADAQLAPADKFQAQPLCSGWAFLWEAHRSPLPLRRYSRRMSHPSGAHTLHVT
ncbi:MAG: hypothetical protein ABI178_08500 [Rhodanobacter sp.]